MDIPTTLTAEFFTADRADNVFSALDLVDEKAFLISKILVTSRTVVMSGVLNLVLLHFLHRAKEATAVIVGTWHIIFESHFPSILLFTLISRLVCEISEGDQGHFDEEGYRMDRTDRTGKSSVS